MFANVLGVFAPPRVPVGPIALVLPAAILSANLVAAVHARLAAAVSPAEVLRTE